MAPYASDPSPRTESRSAAKRARGAAANAAGTITNPVVAPRPMVVLYDAECRFCRRRIEWIRARDDADAFQYLPLQSPEAHARLPGLRDAPLDAGMRVLMPDQRCAVGADAVIELLARLPRWHTLATVLRTPGLRAVFGWLYRLVARHRRLLP